MKSASHLFKMFLCEFMQRHKDLKTHKLDKHDFIFTYHYFFKTARLDNLKFSIKVNFKKLVLAKKKFKF